MTLVMLAGGCVGGIGDADEALTPAGPSAPQTPRDRGDDPPAPATGPGAGPGTGAPPISVSPPVPGPGGCTDGPGIARLARLTPKQFENTVAVLFNGRASAARPAVPLPKGLQIPLQPLPAAPYSTYPGSHGMNDFEVRLSLLQVGAMASSLVSHVRATRGSCLATGSKVPAADCAAELVTSKGEILFRRPLAREEVAHYQGLFTANAAALGNDDALKLMLQAMIMAPQSLFLVESAEAGRLGPFALAASVAYALTDGPPDEELWAAAKRGEVETAAQIRPQIARLLGALDGAQVRRFVEELFEYDSVMAAFKTASGYDREALHAETSALVADVLATNGRRDLMRTLLTTPVGFVSSTTAALYGMPAPPKGERQRVMFAPADRVGILTQPSFLAGFSDMDVNEPVKRGHFISEKILCRTVPDLPIGQVPPLPPAGPETPMRQRLAQHGADPSCAACHKMMDPLGLAFEIYEHTGRRRATPVDATGVLEGSGNQDGPFRDALELVQRLASSSEVERCFAQQSFRYWMGREDRPEDACAISRAAAAYRETGGDYVALVEALFVSRSFLERKAQ